MFESVKSVFHRLTEKLKWPAAAFGAIGVSTTLACCYGPPPDYPVDDMETVGACESMLVECAKTNGLWSEACATASMSSCMTSIERLGVHAYDRKSVNAPEVKYEDYLLKLLDDGELTKSATLMAFLHPWKYC